MFKILSGMFHSGIVFDIVEPYIDPGFRRGSSSLVSSSLFKEISYVCVSPYDPNGRSNCPDCLRLPGKLFDH